jgi:tRNA (guanine37-N1)-methyltransferase
MFPGPLGQSLAGKALEKGLWRLETSDIRSFATDKHRTVDDTPFGGGPGMVMRPDVVDAALEAATSDGLAPAIYLTPRGRRVEQALVRDWAAGPGMVLVCGRYEGLDERVIESRGLLEVSLGDIVLSGGEPAAIAVIDACVRMLPGVMGAAETLEEESFERGLLEYPHYTRPAVWQGRPVPEVLLSGHHEKINAWRRRQAEDVTRLRRPGHGDAPRRDRRGPRGGAGTGREGDLFQPPRPGAGPGAGARDRGAAQGHAALRPL